LAAAIQVFVQGTFGHHAVGGVGMVQRRQQAWISIGAAAFDAYRALATGRQAVVDADGGGDAVFEAEADQAGGGEDDGVVLAGIELGQAVLTLPRRKRICRSGRRVSSCAWRRRLEVPTMLPAGSASRL
jgi:hypothetical protein